jgi:hypothetical protein
VEIEDDEKKERPQDHRHLRHGDQSVMAGHRFETRNGSVVAELVHGRQIDLCALLGS